MSRARLAVLAFTVIASSVSAFAQQPAAPAAGARAGGPARTRPPLFFKEEWKQNEKGGEHGVGPDAVGNPNLEVKMYGPAAKEFLMSGSAGDETNPIHLWTGMCTSPCGATLRHKTSLVDLSGLARIKWNTKMSGFHQVRPLIKLADGTFLVGDRADGSVADWLWSEISFADVKWLRFDVAAGVTKGTIVPNPDLSKVDEVGFVDLMPSSGHGQGGWSDVAQIEVYGRPVAR
ncbi:MAG TPA: hypothetical protein VFD69_21295 [Vicinamibacterales bacterium]|nr:hypothetical protein [Vicinamibacterales bacterium]